MAYKRNIKALNLINVEIYMAAKMEALIEMEQKIRDIRSEIEQYPLFSKESFKSFSKIKKPNKRRKKRVVERFILPLDAEDQVTELVDDIFQTKEEYLDLYYELVKVRDKLKKLS